jgi:hypothetical protein
VILRSAGAPPIRIEAETLPPAACQRSQTASSNLEAPADLAARPTREAARVGDLDRDPVDRGD